MAPRHIRIAGPQLFAVAVVGESNYQKALQAICGRRKAEGEKRRVDAVLVPEHRNRRDRYAVRVEIQGKVVGHLSGELALRYRGRLATEGYAGAHATVGAEIRGGWKRGRDEGHYGVWLDLPERFVAAVEVMPVTKQGQAADKARPEQVPSAVKAMKDGDSRRGLAVRPVVWIAAGALLALCLSCAILTLSGSDGAKTAVPPAAATQGMAAVTAGPTDEPAPTDRSTPTDTIAPTDTPVPTTTPTPTSTRTPTDTPKPTMTPRPTATDIPDLMRGLLPEEIKVDLEDMGFACEVGRDADYWVYSCSFDTTAVMMFVEFWARSFSGIDLIEASIAHLDEPDEDMSKSLLLHFATMPYEGAEPARAKAWIEESLPTITENGDVRTDTFGGVDYQLYGWPKARTLQMGTLLE